MVTQASIADGASNLQASFERRVLQGLLAEWENALWLLPETLRKSVKKPLFTVREMHGRLGCWDPNKREIALSRELVGGHRWDDVKEVLLHEMAHQVAHEGMQAVAESDHGDCFQKACRLLRANPSASGAYLPLHTRLHHGEELSHMDRVVVKIHKLMALAESSNPNEAHAAMRKAYQLIARHNVDLINQRADQEYTSIFLGPPRLRHFREAYHLAHLLQNYYFVQSMWIQAWVLERRRMGRVLEISGSRKNVQVAEYVYEAVCRYIDTAWECYCHGKDLNRFRKTDFAIGVIAGFTTTLQQASTPGADGNPLPVRIQDHALTRYMAHRYPHVRTFSRKGSDYDTQVMADGTESGRKLVIAKGIASNGGFDNRLIAYNRQEKDG